MDIQEKARAADEALITNGHDYVYRTVGFAVLCFFPSIFLIHPNVLRS